MKWYHLSFTEMPNFTATLRVYAAALAAAGRDAQAREIGGRLMALEPDFTIAAYARTRMPFRDEAIKVRYITDLHAAGLPA
jgi:adenylate cyclase